MGTRWTSTHWSATLARDVRAAWDALPERAWRTWLSWMGAGFVLANLVSLVVTLSAERLVGPGLAWDEAALERFVASPLSLTIAIWLNTLANPVFLGLVVLVAAVWLVRSGALLSAATVLIAYPLGTVPVVLGWLVWSRARPDVLAFELVPGLRSFPSGHAVHAIAVYGVLAYLWARRSGAWTERLFAFGLAGLVVALALVGRLRLGVHWPTDMLGALPIAGVWVASLVLALVRAEGPRDRAYSGHRK